LPACALGSSGVGPHAWEEPPEQRIHEVDKIFYGR
jgi:hypothetical protein